MSSGIAGPAGACAKEDGVNQPGWTAAIRRMAAPGQGRRYPGFFNFGPLALDLAGVERVTVWGGATSARRVPGVGFDVRCRNGMALLVALDAVSPGEPVATPFMADRARVEVRRLGAPGQPFAGQDVESALALVAMVCRGTG